MKFSSLLSQIPWTTEPKDATSVQSARESNHVEGVSRRVSSFLPAGWDDIKGVPLAFVQNDLIEAGNSGERHDARTGLLDILRIELSTPEHNTVFPNELLLHTEFTKDDRS